MAKGTRGGKRAVTTGGGVAVGGAGGGSTSDQSGASDVQQVTPAASMSADFNAFAAMSDDEKADVILNMKAQGVPAHLAQNDYQAFIYNIGLNDKPELVDDSAFSKLGGITLYRTVNNVYDRQNDISYSAPQIAKQIQGGSITRVSDTGGSALGRGLYFADDKSHSLSCYGKTKGDIKKTAYVKSKFNSNAKIIDHDTARTGANNEIRKGTKLGKALAKCDYESQESLYAVAKGYNVIKAHNWQCTYYNVLNRQAMTMSKAINQK